MNRLDVVRSLLREATSRVRDRAAGALPLDRLRELASDVMHRRVRIPEPLLTRAVAHARRVEEASVRVHAGALYVDARDPSGPFEASFRPEVRAFAPRGAKELVFHVAPEEAVEHPLAAEITNCLAGVIAHHLWAAAAVSEGADPGGAFVEREPGTGFRVDLRTVPAVRAALEGPSGIIVEALAPSHIEAAEGALKIELALPAIFGP